MQPDRPAWRPLGRQPTVLAQLPNLPGDDPRKAAVNAILVFEGAVFAGCGDCAIRRFSLASGQCEATLQGHRGFVSCFGLMRYARTGGPAPMLLLSGSYDHRIHVWATAGRDAPITVLQGHRGVVHDLVVDDSDVFSAGHEGTVR